MQNVMEAVIVTADNIMAPMLQGDARAIAAAQLIGKWLAEAAKRPKPRRFLCLDCDTEFHARRMPEAFAINFPYARDPEGFQSMVTGICRRCAEEKGESTLLAKYLERARAYYPDLTMLQCGQA
jgi:hypothetical protein